MVLLTGMLIAWVVVNTVVLARFGGLFVRGLHLDVTLSSIYSCSMPPL